jgi:WD40 repeat protein
VAFSPDGKMLASNGTHGFDYKTIKLWDIKSGTVLRTLSGHSNGEFGRVQPDGKLLAIGFSMQE